jgi:hypothetical protein
MVETIKELYRLFQLLNKNFFKDKLELPMILIQSKRKNILGTCSVDRIWINKANKKGKLAKYEITISAENLDRSDEEILTTLLHEMVHLYCSLNNIKDTSNNHVYHNKKFKEEAEKKGLNIEYAKTIGWSITTLKQDTKNLIKTFKINSKVFDYYRKSFETAKKTKKIRRNKYKCNGCDITLNSLKDLNLICGNCNLPFKKETI